MCYARNAISRVLETPQIKNFPGAMSLEPLWCLFMCGGRGYTIAPEPPSLFFCQLTPPSKELGEKGFLIYRLVFTLFLIKQIFEKKKLLGAASGIQMQFWSRITPVVLVMYMWVIVQKTPLFFSIVILKSHFYLRIHILCIYTQFSLVALMPQMS